MKPGRLHIVGAALSAILAVQCLYQNAFLLLAICAAGIVVCARSRQWKRALQVSAIGGVSALSLAPYYDGLAHGAGLGSGEPGADQLARDLAGTGERPGSGGRLYGSGSGLAFAH